MRENYFWLQMLLLFFLVGVTLIEILHSKLGACGSGSRCGHREAEIEEIPLQLAISTDVTNMAISKKLTTSSDRYVEYVLASQVRWTCAGRIQVPNESNLILRKNMAEI